MPSGVVKKCFPAKGFGFITPVDGSEDVFVHRKIVQQDHEASLEQGDNETSG